MIAQTVRHMQTFAFDKGVLAERRVSFRDSRPLTDLAPWRRPLDATVSVPGIGTPGQWLRRIIHMPIGERWLVLSVGAALGSPAAALVAYLVLAVLAEAWTLLGAIRRTAAGVGRTSQPMRQRLADLRDDGPLDVLTRRRSPDGIGGWALPPLVTALEGAAVLTATAVDARRWTAAAFGWFAVVAWHRYDLVYRARRSAAEGSQRHRLAGWRLAAANGRGHWRCCRRRPAGGTGGWNLLAWSGLRPGEPSPRHPHPRRNQAVVAVSRPRHGYRWIQAAG